MKKQPAHLFHGKVKDILGTILNSYFSLPWGFQNNHCELQEVRKTLPSDLKEAERKHAVSWLAASVGPAHAVGAPTLADHPMPCLFHSGHLEASKLQRSYHRTRAFHW